MLSATSRIVSTNKRFVYHRVLQRSVAEAVSDRFQFDPVNAQKTFKKTHDHSTMFKIERYFSAAMIPFLPASYFIHGPAMDTALALAITLHVHWGVHGVMSGPVSYILSICLLAGLLHFNTYDVGITKAFEMVWSL
ncbi:unnamed protein product [Litomosoides sigmodontis]|uniref:Succinate dehydrogenase [ubiquinone] cytochrome b small subunit n=1 Tax=Litomosoides sigmodontis TaxID=42156 RepID=A0A3P6U913_LITSI|nr:unnamed protein product [Litomosoides sigmodontis]